MRRFRKGGRKHLEGGDILRQQVHGTLALVEQRDVVDQQHQRHLAARPRDGRLPLPHHHRSDTYVICTHIKRFAQSVHFLGFRNLRVLPAL